MTELTKEELQSLDRMCKATITKLNLEIEDNSNPFKTKVAKSRLVRVQEYHNKVLQELEGREDDQM